MPRGVPNKRRGRRAAAEEEVVEEGAETTEEPNGYAPPTLGEAIEGVRASLEPFDAATRKKIMRAVTAVLK